jgi:Glyoxalase/Bleomycin resistance protein/Dioxygenase superfamily
VNPLLAPFHQVAYVTNDMERALGVFRDRYGIPSFLVMEHSFDAVVDGAPGRMALRIALANVDDVQVEVIEDLGSSFDLYTESLPEDGAFQISFHHVCIQIRGGIENWERHLAELGDRPHYYRPQTSEGTRAIYTDERAQLGHYIEHCWFGPETTKRMAEAIPHHRTR